jgi:hypothetical protein
LQKKQDWQINHMDVKSAFLHGLVDEDVYIEQPLGYVEEGKE